MRVVDGFVGVSANSARNCATLADMLKRETFPVANIYVPTARRKTLDWGRQGAGRGHHRRLPRRRPEALGDVVKEPLRLELPIGKNDSH